MKEIGYKYGEEVVKELNGDLEISLFVGYDEFPENPRDWGSQLGTMVCWHSRYDLGDKQLSCSQNEFWRDLACEIDPTVVDRIDYWENGDGWTQLSNKHPYALGQTVDTLLQSSDDKIQNIIDGAIKKHLAAILPLYLYDHSGITMRTHSFQCRWDSGQVGWIYATKEAAREEFGVKRVTEQIEDKVERILQAEVAVYDDYLTNNVHYYSLDIDRVGHCKSCGQRTESAVHHSSCGGFLGDIQYMLDDMNHGLAEFGVKIVQ